MTNGGVSKSCWREGVAELVPVELVGIPDEYSDRLFFVADPFFTKNGNLFFEVFLNGPRQKIIGEGSLKFQSQQGKFVIEYLRDILNFEDEEFSFPFNFYYHGKQYLLPERTVYENGKKRHPLTIYSEGANGWTKFRELGIEGVDPVIFCKNNTWFLLTSNSNGFEIYISDDPVLGNFKKHPSSPFNKDLRFNRMAGRPMLKDDNIFLFWQDCTFNYGYAVRVSEVLNISEKQFKQREHKCSPIMTGQFNAGWNNDGMHHIDFCPDRRIAVVDGHKRKDGWKISIITDIEGIQKITRERKPPMYKTINNKISKVMNKVFRKIKYLK